MTRKRLSPIEEIARECDRTSAPIVADWIRVALKIERRAMRRAAASAMRAAKVGEGYIRATLRRWK